MPCSALQSRGESPGPAPFVGFATQTPLCGAHGVCKGVSAGRGHPKEKIGEKRGAHIPFSFLSHPSCTSSPSYEPRSQARAGVARARPRAPRGEEADPRASRDINIYARRSFPSISIFYEPNNKKRPQHPRRHISNWALTVLARRRERCGELWVLPSWR